MRTIPGVPAASLGILAALAAAGLWVAASHPQRAAAAIVDAPQLIAPANDETITTFGPTLQWANPAGTTQYQLQVIPINNDGPGVNLIIGSADTSFAIPAPPSWYGLLPDMSYTWRVRATDAIVSVSETDSGWGPWTEARSFRTPTVSSGTVSLDSPAGGALATSLTPTLTWSNSDSAVYYYEVEVSKDPAFGPNAFLYSERRHGAVTTPLNSYAIPGGFPLEAGTTYYWRVRPRVQGDGTPVEWPAVASFRTPAANTLLLEVAAPADESTVNSATAQVTGKTARGATVTVNETIASVDSAGGFAVTVTLLEGPNVIDIIASDDAGNVLMVTLVVTYIP
ncbi:MAG: hypothetical protein HYY02_00550 [Chloroflexi bacterium]|nr:hypothetical protein [Chloroflexota bacterium]